MYTPRAFVLEETTVHVVQLWCLWSGMRQTYEHTAGIRVPARKCRGGQLRAGVSLVGQRADVAGVVGVWPLSDGSRCEGGKSVAWCWMYVPSLRARRRSRRVRGSPSSICGESQHPRSNKHRIKMGLTSRAITHCTRAPRSMKDISMMNRMMTHCTELDPGRMTEAVGKSRECYRPAWRWLLRTFD
jgi:hypothetical protein